MRRCVRTSWILIFLKHCTYLWWKNNHLATRLSNGSWHRFICRKNNSIIHIIDHLEFSDDATTCFRYFLACDAADYVMVNFESSIMSIHQKIDVSHNYLYSKPHTPNAFCYEYHFPSLSSVVTNFNFASSLIWLSTIQQQRISFV